VPRSTPPCRLPCRCGELSRQHQCTLYSDHLPFHPASTARCGWCDGPTLAACSSRWRSRRRDSLDGCHQYSPGSARGQRDTRCALPCSRTRPTALGRTRARRLAPFALLLFPALAVPFSCSLCPASCSLRPASRPFSLAAVAIAVAVVIAVAAANAVAIAAAVAIAVAIDIAVAVTVASAVAIANAVAIAIDIAVAIAVAIAVTVAVAVAGAIAVAVAIAIDIDIAVAAPLVLPAADVRSGAPASCCARLLALHSGGRCP
jgi:hypothetical protein